MNKDTWQFICIKMCYCSCKQYLAGKLHVCQMFVKEANGIVSLLLAQVTYNQVATAISNSHLASQFYTQI